MTDPFDLQRFVDAQNPIFERVLTELTQGRKESHWMWFIFPQFRGLGRSSLAWGYGIASRDEAAAYWSHTVLGPRLLECTRLVNAIEERPIEEIFDAIDSLKFRSSMTLFAQVTGRDSVFVEALRKYFSGAPDRLTLELLDSGSNRPESNSG
jgi:uncharacterized protein (DUF1810 family)